MCCEVSKMMKMQALLQVPVLVRAPTTGLQVVDMPQYLIRQETGVVAKGLCDVTLSGPLSLLAGNWAMSAITSLKNMNIAQYTTLPDVLRPKPVRHDSVNMT